MRGDSILPCKWIKFQITEGWLAAAQRCAYSSGSAVCVSASCHRLYIGQKQKVEEKKKTQETWWWWSDLSESYLWPQLHQTNRNNTESTTQAPRFPPSINNIICLIGRKIIKAQWCIEVCSMWDEEQGHGNNRDRNLWDRELDTRNNNWGNWRLNFSRIRRRMFHGLWKKKRNRAILDK